MNHKHHLSVTISYHNAHVYTMLRILKLHSINSSINMGNSTAIMKKLENNARLKRLIPVQLIHRI